jgi:hypothetical protein
LSWDTAICLGVLALAFVLGAPRGADAGGFPPALDKIVYTCSAGGPGTGTEVCAVMPDGTGFANLSSNPQGDSGPELSPNGQQIAWQHDITDLWVMDSDGGNPHSVEDADSNFSEPTWAPDGRTLWSHCNNPEQLTEEGFCTIDVTTGEVQFGWVVDFYTVEDLSLSPDGTRLLFTGEQIGTGADLYVLTLATGAVTDITNTDGENEYGTWSPDGQSVAFVGTPIPADGDDDPFANLYRVGPDGNGRTLLYDPASLSTSHSAPAYSPDGAQIAWFCDDGGVGETFLCINSASNGSLVHKYLEGDNGLVAGSDPSWRFFSGPVFGDFDCDEDADLQDMQLALSSLAGAPAGGGCVTFGQDIAVNGQDSVEGDLNCDNTFLADDVLAALRAQQYLWQPPDGCPMPGTIARISLADV